MEAIWTDSERRLGELTNNLQFVEYNNIGNYASNGMEWKTRWLYYEPPGKSLSNIFY